MKVIIKFNKDIQKFANIESWSDKELANKLNEVLDNPKNPDAKIPKAKAIAKELGIKADSMKTLYQVIKSDKTIRDKFLSIKDTSSDENPKSDVGLHVDEIAKNLRLDDANYKVEVRVATKTFECDAKFTKEVWGPYDAPVNKYFDRGPTITMKIAKGEEFVVVYGETNLGNTNYYITMQKNRWYHTSHEVTISSELKKIFECSKLIKTA